VSARTAVLFTGHFAVQARRGSMHWLADEMVRDGWTVRFVTFGYSWLSLLTKDARMAGATRVSGGLTEVRPGLWTLFRMTPFHPVDLRKAWLNGLVRPLFDLYPRLWRGVVRRLTADADLVVLESGLPVLLAPDVRRASRAKLVYRVNDDVRVMRTPAVVQDAELTYAPLFDRISLASPVLASRFEGKGPVGLDPMGLDRTAFDRPRPSPFAERWAVEALCAGTSHFDAEAVALMASLRPEWHFHVLGRLRTPVVAPNVVLHGEVPFDAVVGFVQHADIGLAPYRDLPGVEYQAHHSNRLKQYAYLQLPTLAPEAMLHAEAPHLVGYRAGDAASMDAALTRAVEMDRAALTAPVVGWDQMYRGVTSVCA